MQRVSFAPFDPATKRASAVVKRGEETIVVVKGAPQVIAALVGVDLTAAVAALAVKGDRVLAVAAGPEHRLAVAGLLGFRDPPRDDSQSLVRDLRDLGVRVLMVTGDAAPTAAAVARELEIGARVCGRERAGSPIDCDVLAGVLPEDKFNLVQALQRSKLVVGMTGDGVNDAPALKQAEVGIAVANAADVAKAAASIVLTQPGLRGVLAAVETGRRIYQRMLTYTLNKIVKTIEVALFLAIGFFVTGAMVVTPRQILLLLLTNDFVTMSIASDRVSASRTPERWNVRALVASGLALASGWLGFSLTALAIVRWRLGLPLPTVQTLAFLVLVSGGQANVYLVRERGHFWRSRPGGWLMLASALDLLAVTLLVTRGWLMAPVSVAAVGVVAGGALASLVVLDGLKVRIFRWQEELRSREPQAAASSSRS
jgi:H+-transporting ATPase